MSKFTISDLWRPDGTIGRGTYALIGVIGFIIKHNLDRVIATVGFHRPWGMFNYWVPLKDVAHISALSENDEIFLATMVACSLPFIWVGVILTMKRLRDTVLPASLVALFFVPFLNLLFFLVLALVPGRREYSDAISARKGSGSLARFFPESALGNAALSLLITVPLGVGITLFGSQSLGNYGWGLFVALPFTVGFVAVVVYGLRQPRTFNECLGVAALSVILIGAALFALAFEGLACIIMAAPLALPLALFGGACAYGIQRRRWLRGETPAILSALLLFGFTPGIEWAEHLAARPSPVIVVRTAIDVQAPPEKVWKEVVAFSEIPPPTEAMFRVGIAYPIRAEMLGRGVGAERHCVFSTGAFVEPIEVWDEPRLLKFSVVSNPAPMEEWTPYSHVTPRHLHGFLISEGGQFLLTPLPNGGTRLEGTTWYQHGLWPAAYWQIWSDAIIHKIHLRVLNHIRDEVERSSAVSE
jgi:hypothetical protein